MSKLYVVAELMDEFTRAENTAYAERLSQFDLRYRELENRFLYASQTITRLRRQLRDSERALQTQVDLNEALEERTHYLEQFIISLRDFPQARTVRRRLDFETIDLTTPPQTP